MLRTNFLSVCAFIILLSAFPSFGLTLNEAVSAALKANPEVQAAKSRWEASRSAAVRAYFLPDPKIGADYEDIPDGSSDLSKAEMQFSTVSQAIPWPGMLYSEGTAASAASQMYYYSYLAKQRETVRRVKAAYFDLSKFDQLIKIASANLELMRGAYRTVQTHYSSGMAPQVEVLKMQIELNKMDNELWSLREERSVANLKLSLILNVSSPEIYNVDGLPQGPLKSVDQAKAIEAAMANSPLVKMEESALEEKRAMVGSALSSYLPETMIKWRGQRVGPSEGSSDYMLEFSVPLWFMFRQNSLLDEAGKTVDEKEAQLESMKNMVRLEVKERLTMFNILSRKAELYGSSLVPSAQSALEASLAGYRAGTIDFLNMIDSFRTDLEISGEYYEILSQYNSKLAELEEIIGVDAKNI